MRSVGPTRNLSSAAGRVALLLLFLLPALLAIGHREATSSAPIEAVIVLPEDGRAPFIREIDAATESIRLYLYLLSDDETIRALIRAHRRGVDVRVILEPQPFGGARTELETWQRLDASGIDARWSPGRFRFAHIKMLVIDERVALIMNLNLTQAAFVQNREFALLTTDPEVCGEAVALFESDWAGHLSPPPVRLVTSPETSRAALLGFLASANASIDIYSEFLTDSEVVAALTAALKRGVKVRIIMSEIPGTSLWYEEPGFLARSGAEVYVLDAPYIHAKAIIVDASEVWLGSQNLTANSLDNNREAGIFVDDPIAVQRMLATFNLDAESATQLAAPGLGAVTSHPK